MQPVLKRSVHFRQEDCPSLWQFVYCNFFGAKSFENTKYLLVDPVAVIDFQKKKENYVQ